VLRREEKHVTGSVMNIKVGRWRGRGRANKRCINCVRQDMREMDVSDKITTDREEWKKDMLRRPYTWDKGRHGITPDTNLSELIWRVHKKSWHSISNCFI
jgi:hypothetical protein